MAFAPLLRCWQLTFRKGIAIAFLAFGGLGVSTSTAANAVCLDVPFQGLCLHNLTINCLNGYRYFYAIPLKQSEVNWTFSSKHEGGRQKSKELIFFQIFLMARKTGQRREKRQGRIRNGKKREGAQGESS